MTKLKQPLMSFEGSGSIAGLITLAHHKRQTVARTKPIPAYRRTLLQQYQRWLYLDALTYWSCLTSAQKKSYRAVASRRNIPIFAAYIRDYLRNFPDLHTRWHLDSVAAGVTLDTSPNQNDGIVTGATVVPGLIDHALSFDGIDNHINFGACANLDIQTFTVSMFTKPYTITANCSLLGQYGWGAGKGGWTINRMGNKFRVGLFKDMTEKVAYSPVIPAANEWYFVHTTYDLEHITVYLDLVPGTPVACTWPLLPSDNPMRMGCRSDSPAEYLYAGAVDHASIINRVITPGQALTNSLRRYP